MRGGEDDDRQDSGQDPSHGTLSLGAGVWTAT
jgi:hypothetical protein